MSNNEKLCQNHPNSFPKTIKEKILQYPDKETCPLCLLKEIKLTALISILNNVKLDDDSINSVTNFYSKLSIALSTTTNNLVTIPKLESLDSSYHFHNAFLPLPTHHLYKVCLHN